MHFLILSLIFVPLLGGVACLFSTRQRAKHIALGTTILSMLISFVVAFAYYSSSAYAEHGAEVVQFFMASSWIDSINVEFRIGVDGLSLPLVLLTTVLSVLVVLASWNIDKATNAFMALYLFLLTGMVGVFVSLDLFLFYVFFEISLLPMYFLIGIWGGPRKEYAAIKFFIYTLVGSICLLIVMLGLYFYSSEAAGAAGNVWTMVDCGDGKLSLQSPKVQALFSTDGPHFVFAQWAFWLTLIAFLVKLPGVPFHTWLPDAHVEAPTPISMVLAGVLLKMGGYAMMRVTWPIFPEAAKMFWVCAATLGVIAIIYGALCAMAQTDWKKLVAYSSVSHMGYVTLGIAVMTKTGWDGAYYQMIGHGITSAMMFFMVGVVYERAHHREINRFGGLWLRWPEFGGWSLLCFFAGMGLPGLCGFIGEIMVLLGTFGAADAEHLKMLGSGSLTAVYTLGILAASGVILTAAYILWMFQRIYMGPDKPEYDDYQPINDRERVIMVVLGLGAVLFGLVPWLVFSMTTPTFDRIMALLGVA